VCGRRRSANGGTDGEDKEATVNAGRVLAQLHEMDPTSEHFRYPVRSDGSETPTTVDRIHMRRFHEAMKGVAHFLDGSDTGLREMIQTRAEYEEAMVYEHDAIYVGEWREG
jgi:hypothetical protein